MDSNIDDTQHSPAGSYQQRATSSGTLPNEFVGLSITNSQHLQLHHQAFADDYLQPPLPPPPPPPPAMGDNSGVIAFDITEKFRIAAQTLEPGELVKDGHFTLFESVGALEIMDPKMDSGFLAPGESLDEDYDVTRPLLPREVIGIIDRLLSLEMAWHLGHPLSQTLLTNVYIERMLNPEPMSLEEADFIRDRGAEKDPMHQVLRAYCLGLVKTCWFVNERIKQEHYHEEEDFVTNTYTRSLLEDIDADEIRDEIMEARKVVYNLRHRITDEVSWALGFRLELRSAFLRVIELSDLRSDPDSLSLPWSQMKSVWEAIEKSRHLGTPVPEAFSTKIQRRLASTMPPRPIVELSPDETYKHFKKLIADGIAVLDVLKYEDTQSLLNFVVTFQAQKPQPMVYIRTLLQSFLFKDMVILGRLSIRHILDADLCLIALPSARLLDRTNDLVEAPHHPHYAIAHQMELFRQRAAQSYLDIFRVFCQNRCRIRRTLFHSIHDWDAVHADALDIDSLLQHQLEEPHITYEKSGPLWNKPLSSWAYFYKLRIMEWCVQFGFELEIYAPDELPKMYYYLYWLTRTRVKLIEHFRIFVNSRYADYTAGIPNCLTVNTNVTENEFIRSRAYLNQAHFEAAATSDMAESLTLIYKALMKEKLIDSSPPQPYGNDALRFQFRMRGFARCDIPGLPEWEEYLSLDGPRYTSATMLEHAKHLLIETRRWLEGMCELSPDKSFTFNCHERWKEGVENILRSLIAMDELCGRLLELIELRGAGGLEGVVKVEIGKPKDWHHEFWAVPTLVELKGVEGGGKK
ncbi:putative MAK10 subunit [Podospora fimiseda]|uniref:MAK10 subunit n=1 Tax=Podospora fimiseda TaxID=252190 RepID=A0AAN7BNA1_9PEZI|nr:putative MAK10 subunit [Podospora fimiseda]